VSCSLLCPFCWPNVVFPQCCMLLKGRNVPWTCVGSSVVLPLPTVQAPFCMLHAGSVVGHNFALLPQQLSFSLLFFSHCWLCAPQLPPSNFFGHAIDCGIMSLSHHRNVPAEPLVAAHPSLRGWPTRLQCTFRLSVHVWATASLCIAPAKCVD